MLDNTKEGLDPRKSLPFIFNLCIFQNENWSSCPFLKDVGHVFFAPVVPLLSNVKHSARIQVTQVPPSGH